MTFPRKPIPPAVVAAMLNLWGDGLSASQIGNLLGVTRNSVIGKINRLRINFGSKQLTVWDVAGHLERGGCHSEFDGDEPFGQFALAEMRRKLGRQAA